MKKLLALTLALLMTAALLPALQPHFAHADDRYLEINGTTFPDDNFRNWIIDNLDVSGDAETGYYMTEAQVLNVLSINVDKQRIESVRGIEHFKNLTCFECGFYLDRWIGTDLTDGNHITDLDLSQNTALTYLDCSDNGLETLDVSNLTSLQHLCCGGNGLSSINTDNNPELLDLFCDGNVLTSLDTGNNTKLDRLWCHENNLSELDVSKNSQLRGLMCDNNRLTVLDVSMNPMLESLTCMSNMIHTLTVGDNPGLSRLDCGENQLQALDVSPCSALDYLYCANNQIETLDVSQNTGLTLLCCRFNEMISLNIRGCVKLENCDCSNNQLASLDVSGLTALKDLSCGNNQVPLLDVSDCGSLKTLSCFNNELSTLDVTHNPELSFLSCDNNQLQELDVSHNPVLRTLYCGANQLTLLNLRSNPALETLNCYNNQLTALNVADNPVLSCLYCEQNQLTELDIGNNPELIEINCRRNFLSELDTSNNTKLKSIVCSENDLKSLDVGSNLLLTWLECGRNHLSVLDLSANTELSDFDGSEEMIPGQEGEFRDGCFTYDLTQIVPQGMLTSVFLQDEAGQLDIDTGIVTFPSRVNSFSYLFATGHGDLDVTVQFVKRCGDDLYWEFDESTGTLTITGSGDMRNYSSAYDVPWRSYREQITDLVLPEELTSIGSNAFFDCTKLKSIVIPDNVTRIGASAFADCSRLSSAAFGESVAAIQDLAFACSGLVSVTIPESVTMVGSSAFMDCTRLQSVVISDSAVNLHGYAFSGCAQLSSVSLGSRVTGIGDCAFQSCSKLEEITIPDSVTSIGSSAFSGCNGLSSVTLGNGLTKIGQYAFRGCAALQSIAIPDSVTSIGTGAFINCRSLTPATFRVGAGNTAYKTVDGVLFSEDGTFLHTYLCGSEREQYDVPEDVTSIGDSAFYSCVDLTSVTIPSGVVSIGDQAFYFCTGLESITIPESVTTIGDAAFQECSHLTAIAIPSGVTVIGVGEFSFCTRLTSVVFGIGVTSIGKQAFYHCPALTDVYYLGTEAERYRILDDQNGIANDNEKLLDAEWHYMTDFPAYSTVTFHANGGEGAMAPQTVRTVFPEKLDKNRFVNEGYTFTEWNTEANGTGKAYADEEVVVLPESVELYAQWKKYSLPILDATVEWNEADVEFKGSTPYVIANGKAQTPRFTVKNSADGSVVDPKNYDYEYRENTNAGTGYVIVTFKGDYSGTAQGWFKIYLPATEHTYVENVSNGIKVTWDPVEGAAGYVIYRRAWSSTTNGWTTFERWNNVTGTTYIDGADANHKVYAGSRYQYGVKAYFARRTDPVSGATIGGNVGDNYNLGEVGPLKTTVRITTRKLVEVRPGSKQMTVKWEASKNFTGYQIKYATDANFTKNIKAIKIGDPTTYWTTIRELQSNTTYYVRIRSYHEFNGMTYFGEWSNVLSCKVK